MTEVKKDKEGGGTNIVLRKRAKKVVRQIHHLDSVLNRDFKGPLKYRVKLRTFHKKLVNVKTVLKAYVRGRLSVDEAFIADIEKRVLRFENKVHELSQVSVSKKKPKKKKRSKKKEEQSPISMKDFTPQERRLLDIDDIQQSNIRSFAEDKRISCGPTDFCNLDFSELNIDYLLDYNIVGNTELYKGTWHSRTVTFQIVLVSNLFFSETVKESFVKDAESFFSMRHPNILRCYGMAIHENSIGTCFGYCKYGDLGSFLKENKKFPVNLKIKMLYQTASVLSFLHNRGHSHGNLELRTIFVDEALNIKLSYWDLNLFVSAGITNIVTNTKEKDLHIHQHTFISPESISQDKSFENNKDKDRFAFGTIMYILLSEQTNPFGDDPLEFLLKKKKIKATLKGIGVSRSVLKLLNVILKSCWEYDTLKRKAFEEVKVIFEKIDKIIRKEANKGLAKLFKKKSKLSKVKKDEDLKTIDFSGIDLGMNNVLKCTFSNETKGFVKFRQNLFSKFPELPQQIFTITFEQLKLTKYVDAGGFGNVFKGKYKDNTVVFKSFRFDYKILKSALPAEFEREILLFLTTKHPNICHFYGLVLQSDHIGIVMEYCKFGDLKFFLSKNQLFPFEERLRICYEICQGMEYLHSKNIIHKDLKMKNVLVSEDLSAKVMDFGMKMLVSKHISKVKFGSKNYLAPEMIWGEGKFDEKVDVFSFSIMLYQILTRKTLVFSKKMEFEYHKDPNARPSLIDLNLPTWIEQAIKTSWAHDPHERPSFTELSKMILDNGKIKKSSSYDAVKEREEIKIYVNQLNGRDSLCEAVKLKKFTLEGLMSVINHWRDGKCILQEIDAVYLKRMGHLIQIKTDQDIYFQLNDDDDIRVTFLP